MDALTGDDWKLNNLFGLLLVTKSLRFTRIIPKIVQSQLT